MNRSFHSHKVMDPEKAREKVREWQSKGDRVVFTNGCFDLLHPGHIDLLGKAKALGDRLVIGLNSDDSVRRLQKGKGRPVNDERSRAILLAALASVDLVLTFEEDTPLRTIQSLNPDVLVKGSDYQEDRVVGKEHVEGYGGKVVRLPLLEGYSSSSIIERIRNSKAN